MNKKILLVNLGISSLTAVSVLTIISLRSPNDVVFTEASTTRTMTFNGSHKNYTTANGNKFSSYWIEKQSGSDSSYTSYFVYLQGTSDYNTYTDTMTVNKSTYGIRGNYKFTNVTRIQISYKLECSFSYIYLYSLNSSGGLSGCWEVASHWTENVSESTWTKDFTSSNSYFGFALQVDHHSTNGGSHDTMKATIKSMTITYKC